VNIVDCKVFGKGSEDDFFSGRTLGLTFSGLSSTEWEIPRATSEYENLQISEISVKLGYPTQQDVERR
jgi:hypothetical protein